MRRGGRSGGKGEAKGLTTARSAAQHQLMELAVAHLHKYAAALPDDAKEAGCHFLANAIDTEAYMTR